MKKHTWVKWVLAGATMMVAFACQPKTSSSSKEVPNDESEIPLSATPGGATQSPTSAPRPTPPPTE